MRANARNVFSRKVLLDSENHLDTRRTAIGLNALGRWHSTAELRPLILFLTNRQRLLTIIASNDYSPARRIRLSEAFANEGGRAALRPQLICGSIRKVFCQVQN